MGPISNFSKWPLNSTQVKFGTLGKLSQIDHKMAHWSDLPKMATTDELRFWRSSLCPSIPHEQEEILTLRFRVADGKNHNRGLFKL